MATIQQELVIKARADVSDAKKGLASLDSSVEGLAAAQEGLKSASADAVSGLNAEASAAQAATSAVKATAKASEEAAAAAAKLESDAKGAGSGMDKAAGEARKLTDQIKEVGDGMDIAAGKMVEGIGGPKAIKAIGMAGLALGALKEVAAAFLESSEALFKSWGEEGLKVWDVTERGLFKLKGQFAGAILGTDDMYLAAGRLATGFEALNAGIQMVIANLKEKFDYSPGGQLIKYLFDVTGATEGYAEMVASATERIKRQVAAEKEAAATAAGLVKPIGTAREQYESMRETVDRLTGKIVDKDKVERDSTIQRLKDLQTLAIAEERNAQLKAIRDNAELKRAEFTATATRELMARGEREAREYISNLSGDDRALLSAKGRTEIIQERIARLIETERPAMIEKQMAAYRSQATALMAEMNSPLEASTQLLIEQFQYQINEIEKNAKPAAGTAGNNIGKNFVSGVVAGVKSPESNWVEDLSSWLSAGLRKIRDKGLSDAEIKAAIEGPNLTLREIAGAPDALTPEEQEYYRQKKAAEDEAYLQKIEIDLGLRKAAEIKKSNSQDEIKAVQETSGAVLDLANAFATLGGVQNDVISKMRQVVDVVIKIMQATEALSAVQAAQAATATASAAATATAASSAGAAVAGAGASAGSAFVPVLGAVTAAIGLLGSLFSGDGSTGPQRRTRPRTVYTSAGESQGAGGDFAYFEGGRSNVTIVTNDAASIRAMQGRLAFVGSRGGSGF